MAKIKRAYSIAPNGTIQPLLELEGKELALKDLYPLIGNRCHTVERVALKKGVELWVDEEGLLKENTINITATGMYRDAYKHIDPRELGVVGTAILVDNTKEGGYMEEWL